MAKPTAKHVFLLLLLGGLWGSSFAAIKVGLDSFSPIYFAALRYDLAALAMLLLLLARRGIAPGLASLWPASPRQRSAIVVSAAFNVLAYHAFLFWGQQFTTSAIAGIIVALNPIATTFLARAILPEDRVDVFGMIGLVLGLVGIVLLLGLKPGQLLDARGIGELAIVASILSWAVGAVLVKRIGHRMAILPFTVAQMSVGAVMLHGASLVFEGTLVRAEWNAVSTASMLYLAVVASGFGFWIYFGLLESIGAIRTALVSYIAPLFAVGVGWAVLGEAIEARGVLAFALIALGFRLVIHTRREHPKEGPRRSADATPVEGPEP